VIPVAVACATMLAVTGVLCLVRIVRGPTMLDRTVAADVFVAACLSAVGVEAAISGHVDTAPVLLALALVGFLGSVSIARFAARDIDAPPEDR
jgi:multicomponent Na+:H+ antiporter subunit F